MQAGRELNELIATKIMGWRLKHYPGGGGGFTAWVDDEGKIRACKADFILQKENFNPSTNIADAWKVVEKMAERYQLGIYPTSFGAWVCQGYEPSTAKIRVQADTAPLAICLAALRAMGVEVCEK